MPGRFSLPIPSLGPHGLTPEVLAPVRVVVSLSINTYSPHPSHSCALSDFPAFAGYTESLCCAGAPRLPTSGSELSLLILVSMQPSMTTENSPVAYTQFLHRRHSLHLRKTDSAFSSIHYSPLRVGGLFAANGSLLSLQPADWLAPLTDPTLLALCRLGRLLRSIG